MRLTDVEFANVHDAWRKTKSVAFADGEILDAASFDRWKKVKRVQERELDQLRREDGRKELQSMVFAGVLFLAVCAIGWLTVYGIGLAVVSIVKAML